MSAPTKSKRAPNQNALTYAHPLPLLLTPRALPFLPPRLLNPHCSATYDPASRSVWVTNARDVRVLWERGFFGKGTLSRSEPSWKQRKVAELNGEEVLTAEELTARRRAQRKQFKSDRASALKRQAEEAEAAFAASRDAEKPFELPLVNAPHNVPRPGLVVLPSPSPSKTKAKGGSNSEDEVEKQLLEAAEEEERPKVDPDTVPDLEHLQLTLPEAFFLSYFLSCLRILDPLSSTYLSPSALWSTFLRSSLPSSPEQAYRPDNPFLINYAVYHHFRSLGWVVRGGIKFCVDYLLYKRGPVFQHAEFALVLCPEYEDPADAATCPWPGEVRSEPLSWAWFSTINRVNSQVKKTLVLTYVIIPSMKRLGKRGMDSPACLAEYVVREVVVRRFVPARMRD